MRTASAGSAARQAVLILDDIEVDQRLWHELSRSGFNVTSASTDHIELVLDAEPDLIFIDIASISAPAFDLLDRVRQRQLSAGIVVLAPGDSEWEAIDLLRQGADDYLRYPPDPTSIRAVIDRTLARVDLRRANAALQERLAAELERAAMVQRELLPVANPSLRGFEVAAMCQPAREVGGDFYDWVQPGRGRFCFTLSDVMGKGMPAALMMATVRATLRPLMGLCSASATLTLAHRALEQELDRTGSFVTIFYGDLDLTSGRLQFADAGHGLVVVRDADGHSRKLDHRGLPLGVMRSPSYETGSHSVQPGQSLVLFSDGLLDALPDPSAIEAGIGEACQNASSAAEIMEALRDLVTRTTSITDDASVLVIRRSMEA
ncbi:MAG: PP2C family protein-serine/threonine phosphatase [Chloroflexota bacterium]